MDINEYIKFRNDKELEDKRKKWMEFNNCKGMPVYNILTYSSYERFKKIFLEEYKKQGIE